MFVIVIIIWILILVSAIINLLTVVFVFNSVETGQEKETVKGFAQKKGKEGDGIKYETTFKVAKDFGEVGAILVENEHHKEMYLNDIVLHGLPNGPVNIVCNSWLHSKFENPQKRVFFTTKVSFPI